jgi:hypothetical protein
MPTIDADAHVMEGPRTWEYCDPGERKFMPLLVDPGAESDRQFWLVDGKIRGHVRHVIKPKDFQALADVSGRDMVMPPEAQLPMMTTSWTSEVLRVCIIFGVPGGCNP